MKFLEYANGKYNLCEVVFTSETSTNIQGRYSLRNPVFPLFDLNVFSTSNLETQFDFKCVVKIKDTFMHFLTTYTFTHLSEEIVINILKRFKNDVQKFKDTVDVKGIIKTIKT